MRDEAGSRLPPPTRAALARLGFHPHGPALVLPFASACPTTCIRPSTARAITSAGIPPGVTECLVLFLAGFAHISVCVMRRRHPASPRRTSPRPVGGRGAHNVTDGVRAQA